MIQKSYITASALWPGVASAAFLMGLVGISLFALLNGSDLIELISNISKDTYLIEVIQFTFWQATLSTLISVGIAIPVARAFARQSSFPGRKLALQLLGLPIVTPVIVAVLGIIAVYGQSGILRESLGLIGISSSGRFYGLTGILVAHVFFNLPLSIRMLLPAWGNIPAENWRLAAQVGMESRHLFRWLEWPALTSVIPGTAVVVFLLCFSSFAVVLVLGGGPSAATIEVAIYQALRFDFDPPRAAALALGQLSICTALAICVQRWIRPDAISHGLTNTTRYRLDASQRFQRNFDFSVIALTIAFIALPLTAIAYAGCTGPVKRVLFDTHLWEATGRSIAISLTAASLALILSAGLLIASRNCIFQLRRKTESEILFTIGSLTLAVPPMVTGAGLFLLLLPLDSRLDFGIVVIIVVNATLVLPYMMRTVGPALLDSAYRNDHLCRQLGIKGWRRLYLIDWPIIRQPFGFAVALCATLSLGDMGVAALFDTSGAITLPVLLYHRIGAYRFDEAAVTALILMLLCAIMFLIIDRGIGRWHS